MRISDWSSDVCSSDLVDLRGRCLRRADRGAPRQRLARVRRLLLDRRHRHDRSALSGDAGGMTGGLTGALTGIVTTDLAAVTRGRWLPTERFQAGGHADIGWLPANLSLTAFGGIATPNPWGSTGDLRVIADRAARSRTAATGAVTPFDIAMGALVDLDG